MYVYIAALARRHLFPQRCFKMRLRLSLDLKSYVDCCMLYARNQN